MHPVTRLTRSLQQYYPHIPFTVDAPLRPETGVWHVDIPVIDRGVCYCSNIDFVRGKHFGVARTSTAVLFDQGWEEETFTCFEDAWVHLKGVLDAHLRNHS